MIAERELRDTYDYEHGVKRPMPRPTASEVDRARRVVAARCTGPDAIVVSALYRELAWLEAEIARLSA